MRYLARGISKNIVIFHFCKLFVKTFSKKFFRPASETSLGHPSPQTRIKFQCQLQEVIRYSSLLNACGRLRDNNTLKMLVERITDMLDQASNVIYKRKRGKYTSINDIRSLMTFICS